jgi:hypothetical protein
MAAPEQPTSSPGSALGPLPAPGPTLAAGGALPPRRGALGWHGAVPRPQAGRALVAVPTYRRTESLTLAALGWPVVNPNADLLAVMNHDDPTPDLIPGRTLRVEANNIGEARQHALDYARQHGYEILHLLDDDLLVFFHEAPRKPISPDVYWQALATTEVLLRDRNSDIALMGAALRYRAWTMKDLLSLNTGVVAHASLAVNKVPDHCRYDRLPVYEDADFCLQILRAGLSTAVCKILQFENRAYNKKNRPPVDSGCNTYRAPDLNFGAQELLRHYHPGFIGPQVDPYGDNPGRIHWSKAAAAGKQTSGILA